LNYIGIYLANVSKNFNFKIKYSFSKSIKKYKMPNRLIEASSPYLLQHANNPVDWYPWGAEALEKARNEDKPIIVSIGYSACHWCHVMEHECFENEKLAGIMNEYFVCIKVDREERPDIDQIYMDAVQNMGIRGGWPLNVFLNSSTEPFYGGTYFPPHNWQNILEQIHFAYQNHRQQIDESAKGFTNSLNRSEFEKYNLYVDNSDFSVEHLEKIFEKISKNFDTVWGGMNKVPKFPMPSNYFFLLRIWKETGNQQALDHVIFTLKKMALGGIYDQIGGGFARYSTDREWFLPHFEKMLYDNAQLISLYAEAYLITKEPILKEVVYQTINFVERELSNSNGGFYAALDADSEGEEGKFYVWTKPEIIQILKEDADLFCNYYQVTEIGNWENGLNILCANLSKEEFALANNLDIKGFKSQIEKLNHKLWIERAKRVPPSLDDKILTSWNALMLNGLVDAYRVFDEPHFLELAKKNADFISKNLFLNNSDFENELLHSFRNEKASIKGFLEDYAFVIQAFTNLYQATFEEKWLVVAKKLTETTLVDFYDENEALFYFTSAKAEKLIARKKEVFDNVIPSSNSVMALNLYLLGKLFDSDSYIELSKTMLGNIFSLLDSDPNYLSNWGVFLTYLIQFTKEVAISGSDFLKFRMEIDKIYHPNKVLSGTNDKSSLPILKNRDSFGSDTYIFICEGKKCFLPVKDILQATNLIKLC
jgi:uncharacterized protein